MKATDITQNPRFAGLVLRYHTWPTIRQQTVAEHSWQVARIYEKLFGPPAAEVERYIRWHDAGEIATSDIPSPVKASHPGLAEIFDQLENAAVAKMGVVPVEPHFMEKWRVKLCDLIEVWEFGLEELGRGNKYAQPIIDRTAQSVINHLRKPDSRWWESELWADIHNHIKEFEQWTA